MAVWRNAACREEHGIRRGTPAGERVPEADERVTSLIYAERMGEETRAWDIDTRSKLLGAALALGARDAGSLSRVETDLLRDERTARCDTALVKKLRAEIRDGRDPLGDAYGYLRSQADRRADGAIYTPSPIVEAMVEWAKNGPSPSRVIDPGAGSGRFSVAGGRAFPKAEIIAVELDPVAALLARANLVTAGFADRATVAVEDYRGFAPPAINARTLYLGNPPYVRHHQITAEWKRWLAETARSHGFQASKLAGLHVHFFLATASQGQAGDRGAFITSAEWLDVNYGKLVRELLLDGLGGEAIHVVEATAQPFEDAQTTAAISCFEVGSQPRSIRLRRVKKVADLEPLHRKGAPVRRERLIEARRWTPLTRAARKPPEGYIELGELCRVHRGAVTGANRVWVVDATETDLPESVLFPSVTRARELFVAGTSLSAATTLRRVIDLPHDLDAFDTAERRAIDRFLRRAKKQGTHQGYVAENRRCWWSVGLRSAAPILATYMARRAPAIVENRAEARHINIAHGVYPREELSASKLARLASAIRDSVTVEDGRTYAGGLVKFEPREMERILIPDVSQSPA